MKNKTLKAFYYGSLRPSERRLIRDSEYDQTAEKLSQAEDCLEQALAPELLPLLEELTELRISLCGLTAEVSYIDGFKTGIRFMMEILDDASESENLKPIIE